MTDTPVGSGCATAMGIFFLLFGGISTGILLKSGEHWMIPVFLGLAAFGVALLTRKEK